MSDYHQVGFFSVKKCPNAQPKLEDDLFPLVAMGWYSQVMVEQTYHLLWKLFTARKNESFDG